MSAKCGFCAERAITNLDGDNLCQRHANEWCRGEGEAASDWLLRAGPIAKRLNAEARKDRAA